ncbi:MAG TPA: CaiB/BaiF CoA-transferase family protein [Casimicrobiaceae bacterium]|nr:CaiB/BaiF CoA-transferase family protein [Casimicrobiaceae bacterium]
MSSFAPLSGVRVIDFSKILAGPLCTQYLADLGAEVIKVEPIGTGDDTRHWPPFEDGVGTVFLSVNRNKQSLAIDLKSPTGLEACRRLAKISDVAVESFSPGVAERLGVGYEDLKAINPRIVYCSISGYGTVGPMRDGKGYDVILQAFTGMLSITGEPGGNPVRSPFSPVDQGTGLHAVIGILGGLLECKRTGRGVKVEASLFDTAVSFLGYFLQGYWKRGAEPERPGSGHESLCPYQVFETSDHPLILGVANDTLWQAFCKVANVPEIAGLPQFRTGADRVQHRVACVTLVQDILRQRPREEWLRELDAAGIPCSPVNTLGELSAHPHTRESGMVFDYGPSLKGVAPAVRVDGDRPGLRDPPPKLGAQSVDALRVAGYAQEEIDRMIRDKVIALGT